MRYMSWVSNQVYYSSGRIPKKHDAFFSQVTDLRVRPVARSVRCPLRSSLVDGSISSDNGARWVKSLHSSLHSFPGGAKLCCLEESIFPLFIQDTFRYAIPSVWTIPWTAESAWGAQARDEPHRDQRRRWKTWSKQLNRHITTGDWHLSLPQLQSPRAIWRIYKTTALGNDRTINGGAVQTSWEHEEARRGYPARARQNTYAAPLPASSASRRGNIACAGRSTRWEPIFEHLSFQLWLRYTEVQLRYGGARIVNGDLKKCCEQHSDIIQWDQSNRADIMTHGVSGIDWMHYKHPLPENVYDAYMKYWKKSSVHKVTPHSHLKYHFM